jgi:hypothetical protein
MSLSFIDERCFKEAEETLMVACSFNAEGFIKSFPTSFPMLVLAAEPHNLVN